MLAFLWSKSIIACTERAGEKHYEEHVQELVELTNNLAVQVVTFTKDNPVAQSKAVAHIRKRLARTDPEHFLFNRSGGDEIWRTVLAAVSSMVGSTPLDVMDALQRDIYHPWSVSTPQTFSNGRSSVAATALSFAATPPRAVWHDGHS